MLFNRYPQKKNPICTESTFSTECFYFAKLCSGNAVSEGKKGAGGSRDEHGEAPDGQGQGERFTCVLKINAERPE